VDIVEVVQVFVVAKTLFLFFWEIYWGGWTRVCDS